MEKFLNNWIMNYVDGDPANSSDTTKAAEAACGGRGHGRRDPGQPRLLLQSARFLLRPHYQLEGTDGVAAARFQACLQRSNKKERKHPEGFRRARPQRTVINRFVISRGVTQHVWRSIPTSSSTASKAKPPTRTTRGEIESPVLDLGPVQLGHARWRAAAAGKGKANAQET